MSTATINRDDIAQSRGNMSETIHSGHFMVSDIHDRELKPGYDFSKARKDTYKDYNFVPSGNSNTAIDASLSKLFESLTIAFSGQVVSPKWKTFKGMKLAMSDKIRLNNAIWRAWHIQFQQHKNPVVCQFATPHTDHVHATTQCLNTLFYTACLATQGKQAVVLEGKYWKRTLDTVVLEYKRWRSFFKEKNSRDPFDNDLLELKNHVEYYAMKELEGGRQTAPVAQPAPSPMIIDNDDILNDFSDTLFSSLSNQPFMFPNPREIAHAGNADMIQPGLVQLQPNLDEDFMDTTFEPLQEFLEKVQNSASQAPPGTFVFMGNNSSFLQDITSNSQPLQLAGNSSNLGFQDPSLTQQMNVQDAFSQITAAPPQQQQQQVQQQEQVQQSISQPCSPVTSVPQHILTTPMSIPSSFISGSALSDHSSMGASPPTNLTATLAGNFHIQQLAAQLAGQQALQVNQQPSQASSLQLKPATFTVVTTQAQNLLPQTTMLPPQNKTTLQPGQILNQQSQQPQQVTLGNFTLGQQQQQQPQQQAPQGLSFGQQNQAITLLQQAIELAGQTQTFSHVQPQPQQNFSRPEKKPLVSELLAQTRTQKVSQQSQVTLQQPSQLTQPLTQTVPVSTSLQQQQQTLGVQTVLQTAQLPAVSVQQQPAVTLQQSGITAGLLQQPFQTALVTTSAVVLPTISKQTTTGSRILQGSSLSSGAKAKTTPPRLKQPMKIAPAPAPPSITTIPITRIPCITTTAANTSSAFLTQLLTTGTYPGQQNIPVALHTLPTAATPTAVVGTSGTTSTAVLLQPIKSEFSTGNTPCALTASNLSSTLSSGQQGLVISTGGNQLGDLSSGLLVAERTLTEASSTNQVNVKCSSSITNANTITTATPPSPSTVKGALLQETSPSIGTSTNIFSSTASPTPTSAITLDAELPDVKIDDDDDDDSRYTDTRRVSHISAEQKRRVNIKAGFDTLQSLIPALSQNPSQKVSKASMLQKAVEYTTKLKEQRARTVEEASVLKKEIEALNAAINNTQAQLPATGVPVTKQRFDQMSAMFDDYVRTRTSQNWKFWIFSIIIRPLFESYNGMVSTASMDELCRTVTAWVDQHCSLTALRPAVLASLRQLSTTTSILSDPSQVPEQAAQAVNKKMNTGGHQ
ncbi:MLX-interacting protein-like [Glandiceps talaboti]